MRTFVAGVGVGVSVGAGGACLYFTVFKKQSEAPTGLERRVKDHPSLKYGVPVTEALRAQEGYVVCYDYRTRNPKWVMERLVEDAPVGQGVDRSKSEFFEDKAIPAVFRGKLSDYRNSGYDRGHMAPAANHKSSQSELDATFNMVNISPQVGQGFNRDYWARVERFVKELTRRCDEVLVATGPLWLPTADANGEWTMKHAMIGQPPALVSVPTHYYKVIAADARSGAHGPARMGVGAFVLPNAPIQPHVPLSAFVQPLEAVEAAAGMQFFPEYLASNKSKLAKVDTSAQAWRSHGLAQLAAFERQTLVEGHAALPLPALPAPQQNGSDSSSAVAATPVKATSAPPPAVGGSVVHLCELTACRLPSEQFWNKNKTSAPQGNASRTAVTARSPRSRP